MDKPLAFIALYKHMTVLSEVHAAHNVTSVRDNPVWRRPRGSHKIHDKPVSEPCPEEGAWRLVQGVPRD